MERSRRRLIARAAVGTGGIARGTLAAFRILLHALRRLSFTETAVVPTFCEGASAAIPHNQTHNQASCCTLWQKRQRRRPAENGAGACIVAACPKRLGVSASSCMPNLDHRSSVALASAVRWCHAAVVTRSVGSERHPPGRFAALAAGFTYLWRDGLPECIGHAPLRGCFRWLSACC